MTTTELAPRAADPATGVPTTPSQPTPGHTGTTPAPSRAWTQPIGQPVRAGVASAGSGTGAMVTAGTSPAGGTATGGVTGPIANSIVSPPCGLSEAACEIACSAPFRSAGLRRAAVTIVMWSGKSRAAAVADDAE